MSDKERIWLVWSEEHGSWWRPGCHGYTRTIRDAGRYSYHAAKEICDGANAFQSRGERPNEVMTLSPEASLSLMDACATIPATEFPAGELTAAPCLASLHEGDRIRITIIRADGSGETLEARYETKQRQTDA